MYLPSSRKALARLSKFPTAVACPKLSIESDISVSFPTHQLHLGDSAGDRCAKCLNGTFAQTGEDGNPQKCLSGAVATTHVDLRGRFKNRYLPHRGIGAFTDETNTLIERL